MLLTVVNRVYLKILILIGKKTILSVRDKLSNLLKQKTATNKKAFLIVLSMKKFSYSFTVY
jgi:hypothetical protein